MSNIQDLRHKTSMSQSEFAKYFNIPVRTLQNWEQGYQKPANYIVEMIEKILVFEKKIKE